MSLTGHGRGDAPGSLPGILARLCREGKEEMVSSEAGGGDGAELLCSVSVIWCSLLVWRENKKPILFFCGFSEVYL